MINCIYADESYITTSFLIFYTCIWIPFRQTTQWIIKIFLYLFNPHQIPVNDNVRQTPCQLNLHGLRFEDMDSSCQNIVGGIQNEKEMCSICLMEFKDEDFVCKLPRCQHVFHMKCLKKWLDRCQFTCPLCRSVVLHIHSPPCK